MECCPTSSLLTKAFERNDQGGWESHPIARFVRDGMSVSLSTDDPKVFDIDYKHEVALSLKEIGLSAAEVSRLCSENSL